MSSEGRLWIRASPRGSRSGFAVLPDGAGGRITVTVLPKPWAPRAKTTREYVHVEGSTTHLVLHETEQIAIRSSHAARGAIALNLVNIGSEQAGLLELAATRDHDHEPTDAATSSDPFGALLDLALLAERGSLSNSPLSFEGALAQSFLRLLTHERLLQAVERLIFRARPKYAERTEVLEQPRGRLSERSLLFSMKSGTPRVESTFDELTVDTPLLQVVASALRVIASERLPAKIVALSPGLPNRAVNLLRHLTGVRLLDREHAARVAENLWLSPLDRIWEPTIDAALPVLRQQAVMPEDQLDSSGAIAIHVSTEKFWEQCLELALTAAFPTLAVSRNAKAGEGVNVPTPWAPTADGFAQPEAAVDSYPDFMFTTSLHVVVADAKYKLGGTRAPSSQDGYQLFAYSHLASLNEQRSSIAMILYPTRHGARSSQVELQRLTGGGYPLWLVQLPFPTPNNLRSPTAWSAFVTALSSNLQELSTSWNVDRTKRPSD
nr:hypothetical protein [Curtobacterium pusillum]